MIKWNSNVFNIFLLSFFLLKLDLNLAGDNLHDDTSLDS